MLKAAVRISPGRQVHVIDVHTAAYSTDGTKQRQIDQVHAEAKATPGVLIVGGDFNALPPGAKKLEGFADEKAILTAEPVHYRGESTWMQGMYDLLNPAIPLDDYLADEARYHSASVNKDVFWTRRLDYLFSRDQWSKGGSILQRVGDKLIKPIKNDPMKLSDHAPIAALLPLQ
jgi:endonuclease/exonuclease/phosphatase family metal-dependent hydrolase